MGKYSRLGKNTMLVFIGNIGSKLLSFLMLPVYTAWFSQGDYGTIDLITVCISLLSIFATCSIADSIFRFPKDCSFEDQKKYFTSGLSVVLFGLIITALVFFALKQFWNTDDNVFIHYINFIWGILCVTVFQNYLQQFTRSIDKMNVYVIAGVLLTAFIVAGSFLLIPRFGIIGYLWSQIISMGLVSVYTIVHAKLYRYVSLNSFSAFRIKEMLIYSLPLIPNGTMWWILSYSNRFFLEKSAGLDAIGVLAVSNKFPTLISMVFNMFFISWQISVLEEFKKADYSTFYNKIFRLIYVLLLILTIGISICSYWLVQFMADSKFIDAWRYIPVLSLAVMLSAIASFVGTNFLATKETKYFLISSIVGAIVSIGGNIIFIPVGGLMAAAYVVVLSNMAMLLVRVFYSWKYTPINNLSMYLFSLIIISLFILVEVSSYSFELKIGGCFVLLLLLVLINRSLYEDVKVIFNSVKSKIIK